MDQQFETAIIRSSAGHGGPGGLVRLTAVPIVANRLLAPALGDFLNKHPRLTVELIPESRDLSLTRREADLAIRMARPKTGGTNVRAQRIATLRYGAYLSAELDSRVADELPWITFDDSLAHLPHVQWMRRATSNGNPLCDLRVHDSETALEAVSAGVGRTLLPELIARRDVRLRPLPPDPRFPYPSRDVWLVVHREVAEFDRVRTVSGWIRSVFK